ncbi:MAG: 50S ribosomal protein L17 [Bdellovibrionales bacterium]
MRHRSKRHNFHRRPGPRVALIRGMVYSLVECGRIKTTVARAKEVRRHVEKAITLGKSGTLNSRRLLLSRYPNDSVVETLVTDLSKRFAKRPGGYTRIVKLGARAGDKADMAFLEFVDFTPEKTTDKETTVKGDVSVKVRTRTKLAQKTRSRKRVRAIQSQSRREARA